MPTGKYNSHSSLRKLLFAIEAITENHNQSKYRGVEPGSSRCIFNRTPVPKAQGSSQRRRLKECKSQMSRKIAGDIMFSRNVRC